MIRTLIGLAAAASLSSLALAQSTSDARAIDSFEQLDAGGNFDLRFEPSETASIRFEGDVDDIDDINIDMDGDRLEVRQDGRRFFRIGRRRNLDVTVIVTGPGVERFEFSRGVDANVSGLALDSVSIHASTGADLEIDGRCESARIHVSTGANIDGRNLICESIRAHASTGAGMDIAAENELVAHASTGGDIHSVTSPANLRMHTSTGGDVSVGRYR